jgi:hypothetical protein
MKRRYGRDWYFSAHHVLVRWTLWHGCDHFNWHPTWRNV